MAFLTTVVKILENVVFSGLLNSLCLKTMRITLYFVKTNFFTRTQTILIDRDVS